MSDQLIAPEQLQFSGKLVTSAGLLRRLRRISLALVLALMPLYTVVSGHNRFWMWWLTKVGEPYYVDYRYLPDAISWSLIGIVGLLGSARLVFAPQSSLRWLLLPLLAWGNILVSTPYTYWFQHTMHPMGGKPIAWANERTRAAFVNVLGQHLQIAERSRTFECQPGARDGFGAYAQKGQPLNLHVVCLANAVGPLTTIPPAAPPGTVYVAISPDQRTAWFTVTTLPKESGLEAVWLTDRNGEQVMVGRTIGAVPR